MGISWFFLMIWWRRQRFFSVRDGRQPWNFSSGGRTSFAVVSRATGNLPWLYRPHFLAVSDRVYEDEFPSPYRIAIIFVFTGHQQ
jgi:hypothetical protein